MLAFVVLLGCGEGVREGAGGLLGVGVFKETRVLFVGWFILVTIEGVGVGVCGGVGVGGVGVGVCGGGGSGFS